MIYNLATNLATVLEKKGYLGQNDKEVIAYGLFSVLSKLIYAVVCILCGLLFDCVFQSIVFYISFLFLKKYVGGYHAKTELKCMAFSTASIVLSVLAIYFCLIYSVLEVYGLIFVLFASIVIAFLAPIEADEKPLTNDEKKKYKKYSILRILLLLIVFGILIVLNYDSFSVCIGVAIVLECLLAVAGKFHQMRTVKMEVIL